MFTQFNYIIKSKKKYSSLNPELMLHWHSTHLRSSLRVLQTSPQKKAPINLPILQTIEAFIYFWYTYEYDFYLRPVRSSVRPSVRHKKSRWQYLRNKKSYKIWFLGGFWNFQKIMDFWPYLGNEKSFFWIQAWVPEGQSQAGLKGRHLKISISKQSSTFRLNSPNRDTRRYLKSP